MKKNIFYRSNGNKLKEESNDLLPARFYLQRKILPAIFFTRKGFGFTTVVIDQCHKWFQRWACMKILLFLTTRYLSKMYMTFVELKWKATQNTGKDSWSP